ncbi:MAG: DUF2169 domain-containing protein [Campylobacterota bacterium]|nr:DUF2169 domain-containing protein [Campylobacterota bacterium]
MKTIKDTKTSLLLKSFLLDNQDYLSISALCYFDLNNPDALLEEQAMYRESTEQLGKTILDYAMPKPKAEVLLCGSCHNPLPNEGASHVKLKVGEIEKELYIFGQREWRLGRISEALPFRKIPLDYAHALPPDEYHLPQIEEPHKLTTDRGETKVPAGFMPLDMFRQTNMEKLGTYDAEWKRELWPGFASDMDYSFFNLAPADQQLEQFFEGGEAIELVNMHPKHTHISSKIPTISLRCFATKSAPNNKQKDKQEEFLEVTLRRDTLWLFPEIERGIVIFRGTIAVADEVYSDIRYLNLKAIEPDAPLKTLEEYYELQKRELDKSVEIDNSPFEEANAKIAEAKKEIFDIPRQIKESVAKSQGKRPSLRRTPAEKLAQSHKQIDDALARLESSKLKLRDMKEKFGHINKVDFTALESAKEKLLASKTKLTDATSSIEKSLADVETMRADALKEIEKIKENPKLTEAMREQIDTSSLEPKEKVWSDYAFEFLCDCVKRLEQEPEELHKLHHLGLAQRTIKRSWLGYNPTAKTIKASEWKLESAEDITLAKGLLRARFEEATLKSLRIAETLVLGSDEGYELFLSEGNYNFPLFYFTDEREAYLCDQEAFDICNSLVCDDISSVGESAKQALEEASVVFYLQENGTIEKLPNAKQFDCAEYSNLFELQQNGGEIREQIIQNLPKTTTESKDMRNSLAIERDISAKAINTQAKAIMSKVKLELTAKGETLKKEMQSQQDAALAKANEALAKRGLDPIEIPANREASAFIQASEVSEHFDKAIAKLKRKDARNTIDLKEQIAKLQKAKEEMLALTQKSENMYAEGMKKIALAKERAKDPIPPWAKDMMKKAGIDPDDPHPTDLTRELVIKLHAQGKSFAKKNLSGLDLSRLDLSGIDLTQANCSQTDFTQTDLSRAKASQAIFNESIFDETLFNNFSAKKALFEKAIIKKSRFMASSLEGVVFKELTIEETLFDTSDLSNATFLKSSIIASSLSNAKMDKTLLSESTMSSCKLLSIEAKGMLFNKSKVDDCDFSQSTLINTRMLKESALSHCDLSLCHMDNTTMSQVSLNGCNLQKSSLSRSLIEKSQIERCDFRGVVAKQSRFEYSSFVQSSFAGINLLKGSLRRMDMQKCDFSHSNLYAVELYKTKLSEVDFSSANLKKSNLEDRVELIDDKR